MFCLHLYLNAVSCRNEFDANKTPDLSLPEYQLDTHSLCSLLKIYFRELPNPLFTFALYDKFIVSVGDLSRAPAADVRNSAAFLYLTCTLYVLFPCMFVRGCILILQQRFFTWLAYVVDIKLSAFPMLVTHSHVIFS